MDSDPDYRTATLTEIREILSDEQITDWLKDYRSAFDSDTETFLHEKALEMEKRDISRTYLAFNDKKEILGYFTLSMKCMSVSEESGISRETLQRMNIEKNSKVAQSYLLGQLSRSVIAPKGFGKILIESALKELLIARDKVGCRLLRLDCHDKLVPYYKKLGFRFINKNKNGTLNQMIVFIGGSRKS